VEISAAVGEAGSNGNSKRIVLQISCTAEKSAEVNAVRGKSGKVLHEKYKCILHPGRGSQFCRRMENSLRKKILDSQMGRLKRELRKHTDRNGGGLNQGLNPIGNLKSATIRAHCLRHIRHVRG